MWYFYPHFRQVVVFEYVPLMSFCKKEKAVVVWPSFEKIGSIIFPEMFMAVTVNPQYKFLVALSTG